MRQTVAGLEVLSAMLARKADDDESGPIRLNRFSLWSRSAASGIAPALPGSLSSSRVVRVSGQFIKPLPSLMIDDR